MNPDAVARSLKQAAVAAHDIAWREGSAQVLMDTQEAAIAEQIAKAGAASQLGVWGVAEGTAWMLAGAGLVVLGTMASAAHAIYVGHRDAEPKQVVAAVQGVTDPNSDETLRTLRETAPHSNLEFRLGTKQGSFCGLNMGTLRLIASGSTLTGEA